MDFHMKQWRNYQQEMSEHQNSAKIPKLVIETQNKLSESALPLFVSEPSCKISTLSAFPDSTSVSTRFPRSYFSLAQWQELELQALIFRYMLAGSTVPPELLQPIKKSLLHSSNSFFLHNPPPQHYSPYHSAVFQTGYWGGEAMDPEPGRCRRTDGKKWRCSRDVVSGHKYCERHMHRGRNRSRKPVEIPTTITSSNAHTDINGGERGRRSLNMTSNTTSINNASLISATSASGGTQFALSGPFGSIDLLQLNQSSSEPKAENKNLFEPQNKATEDGKSSSHILRHFFDDWPRSLQESDNGGSSMSSSTSLSMSIPENSSDVSLKLSTGNVDLDLSHHESNSDREHRQLSWAAGWPSNHMGSVGGPLAEALRSSNSNSSPTSVLHQLQRVSVSETSFVSA